ncbi:hypothetical protein [Moorena sp. SIO3H5]|uniref:hypothetical protein n=1 Tax=Moorena sp. SIO3H5 TaxID=2607834 RepID=UPI0013B622D0|nr:hypothetical protein [Moorena sp. SIO3H5]NEO70903.1 hypothetical protein [Moorena sp. SIO3H5]
MKLIYTAGNRESGIGNRESENRGRCGEMGRLGRWGDGEMGRCREMGRCGEMGRWGVRLATGVVSN